MVFKFLKQLFGVRGRMTQKETRSRAVEQKVAKKKAKSVVVTPRLIRDTITALESGLPNLELAIKNKSDDGPRKIIPELRGIRKNIFAIDNYYKTKYSGDLAIIQAQGADAPPFLARDLKRKYQSLSSRYWKLMDQY